MFSNYIEHNSVKTMFFLDDEMLNTTRFVTGKRCTLNVSVKHNDLADYVAKCTRLAELSDSDYKTYANIQGEPINGEEVVGLPN